MNKGKKLGASEVKIRNRLFLLNLLRQNYRITRRELSKLSGLDPSTVTKITKYFIAKNLCRETVTIKRKLAGRRPIVLELNKDAYKSVVVNIGVSFTEIGIGFFDGKVKVIDRIDSDKNFKNLFNEIFEKAAKIVQKIGKDRFLGYSFSVPGMVDIDKAFIIELPHLNVRELDLKAMIPSESDKNSIHIDNEANLSLIAEKAFNDSLEGKHNIVFVNLSEGIGCGVMLEDEIYRGNQYTAGEFGHMTVKLNGEKCYCGNTGCWETVASTEAIVKTASSKGINLEGRYYSEKFQDLATTYRGDPAKERLLKIVEENLASGILNIINGYDPEIIVMGGAAAELPDNSMKRIQKIANQKALYATRGKVKVLRSVLGSYGERSSNIIGAALYAVQRNLEKIVM
ncbi:MAG: ROK family protein [Kosmotoga sp.]|nr:MAG: ROK family protein [Kosmotoga sp.]